MIRRLLGEPPAARAGGSTLGPKLRSRTMAAVGGGVVACAVAGSLLSDPDGAWYVSLDKPSWQPPPAAFPAVWTTLYAVIALAGTATITELDEAGEQDAASSFRRALAANLVANAAWSGLFFRAHHPALATAGAALLAASSADLAQRAARTGPVRAAGFGAYAAWCVFATALSAEIARRNGA